MSAEENTPEPGKPRAGWFRTIISSISGEQHDFTSGGLGRAIVLLSIPMVLELSMESLFALCDIFWVSHLGSDATAAVGLTEALLTLYYAVAIGIAMSVTALVSRRIGEKDEKRAAKAGVQAIYLGLSIGVLTGIPCWIYGEQILGLMGADEDVLAIGSGYTKVILGANVVVMLLFLHNAIFRGAGDAALAMWALWIGNGINLVLDPLLIFGIWIFPEMGLTGAAVATLIGRTVALVFQLWMLSNGRSRIRLRGSAWKFDPAAMTRLLRLSFGGIAQFAVATSSWVFLMRVMATFGSATLAGYTVGIRVLVFTLLPAWGLSSAAATLVGQNLGAKQPDRAEKSVWVIGWYTMAFLGVMMLAFQFFSPWMVSFFKLEEAEAVQAAVNCLRIMSAGYLFYAWAMVIASGFNGAGDTMTPTWMNVVFLWFLQIPLAWWMATGTDLGSNGVFWAVIISESLLSIVAITIFRRGNWKLMTV